MCIFGTPNVPDPKAPVKRETLDTSTGALDEREEQRRRLARQRGYGSTMLTGPGGVNQGAQQQNTGKQLLGQ